MDHKKNERTFIILKPDAIQRSLAGEIIGRLERVGLKLVAMKMMVPSREQVEQHYTLDPDWRRVTGEKTIKGYVDKGLKPWTEDPYEVTNAVLLQLQDYMTSGPVVCMIWQGAHAVGLVRKLIGKTEPLTSDVGTIRGDYVMDSYELSDADQRSIRNLAHASGSVKEAEDEIKHWFKEEEIIKYNIVQEQILYSAKLEGIFE